MPLALYHHVSDSSSNIQDRCCAYTLVATSAVEHIHEEHKDVRNFDFLQRHIKVPDVMYQVEYMYMWFMSRPPGRAQGLTPKGKLFMGVSSMVMGVVTHFSGEYSKYTMGTLI